MSDRHPRRPAWVAWLPAVVLSIVIIGAVAFALVGAPQLADEPAPARTDQVTELNWSVFNDEGLAYIESARSPRIDLSETPVEAAPLDLPADGSLTVGPHQTDLDYRLVLIANENGEPNGAQFTTPQFTLTTTDGALTEIRVELRGVFEFREAFLELTDRAPALGYTVPEARDIGAAITAARESGEPEVITTDVGTAAGFSTVGEVTCFGAGYCQLAFLVWPGVG